MLQKRFDVRVALKFLLFISVLLPILVKGGDLSHKIKVEINPHYIRANQPFSLSFSVTANYIFKVSEQKLKPETNDFTIIGNVRTNSSSNWIKGQTKDKFTWEYTLVPNRAGDFFIEPRSVTLDNGELYTSDSIWIHIYDERISAADSSEKLKAINPSEFNSFMAYQFANKFNNNKTKKPTGIHFNNPDSIYSAKKGEVFEILYSLSLVNVPGMTLLNMKDVVMEGFSCPKNIDKMQTRTSLNLSSLSGYEEFTKEYIIKLRPNKKGKYRIPAIPFSACNQKITAPEIKIIVK